MKSWKMKRKEMVSEPNETRAEMNWWTTSKNMSASIWVSNITVNEKGSGTNHARIIIAPLITICIHFAKHRGRKCKGHLERDRSCHKGKKIVLGGDFSAKIPTTGEVSLDKRWMALVELAARHDCVFPSGEAAVFLPWPNRPQRRAGEQAPSLGSLRCGNVKRS